MVAVSLEAEEPFPNLSLMEKDAVKLLLTDAKLLLRRKAGMSLEFSIHKEDASVSLETVRDRPNNGVDLGSVSEERRKEVPGPMKFTLLKAQRQPLSPATAPGC
jgi:hypothetical protein